MAEQTTPVKPSWMRWPPNCCETCTGWQRTARYIYGDGYVVESEYIGICNNAFSMDNGMVTDSRYRCPSFKRRDGV